MNYLSICPALCLLLAVQAMAQFPPSNRRSRIASHVVENCTPSCKQMNDLKDTPDVVCSCKRSCLIYGDCCRDAPFKNSGDEKKNLGCLTLFGLGPVSIVKSCPPSSGILAEACEKGMGVRVPVTSKDTGTSYANYFCALCNNDGFDLIDWPVQFRCCQKDRKISRLIISETLEYDNQRDVMWAVSKLRNGSSNFCECKFYARNDDLSFAKSLELRECKRHEISTCSHSWDNESTRELCSAYLDPIYNGEKSYRNRHCATCNYVNGMGLKCSEDWFNPRLMSPARLYSFCKSRGISNCEHYVRAKGYAVSFSALLYLKEVQCIPPEPPKCCPGQRYDHFIKKCRKIPTRVVL